MSAGNKAWASARPLLPGLVVALAVALVGYVVHHNVDVVSPHVVAVACGILGATFGRIEEPFKPGLRFCAKKVLRAGIVLLGFRLSLSELGKLGPRALVAVVAVVVATFFGTQWLARRLGLSRSLGLLMATGYSICGASAIAAVEPFADASEEEVAYSIALVTLCGTLAIFTLPGLGSLLGLTATEFGAWVGASVHDVGQVVAAASTHGEVSLKLATLVKLTRVALLAPLLAGVAIAARRRQGDAALEGAKRPPLLPLFILLFLVASAITSTGVLSTRALADIKNAETILLGMGLVGLGSNVDLRKLRAVGGTPLALALSSWALVAVVSLAAVKLSGL
ncbi:MAG: putative sulfate exporter family transporter [Ilumatobacteraceae bacterium]|nr:putative sulfate exporter family transporter [Acidimicrobiaceae bacterium]MBP6488826.1 putative sulfate exporter family transporter [Ilumatobacteraceae bacterium]MBK9972772.1 putative sulfate exporter family transporter [Acidimicrobiaceae bacterium]MBP7887444.1 putative sulfate exporter family transporter [Ilumatobacteraceae bacterium]MBP8209499.1 putative sulfate exporter family transporter [Ilumatobacteraceae bacterium]